jgi:hypothetical protein
VWSLLMATCCGSSATIEFLLVPVVCRFERLARIVVVQSPD